MSALNEINAGNKWASMSYEQFDEQLARIKSIIIKLKAFDGPYVQLYKNSTNEFSPIMYRTEAIKVHKMMYEETLYHACMKGMPDHIKYNEPK